MFLFCLLSSLIPNSYNHILLPNKLLTSYLSVNKKVYIKFVFVFAQNCKVYIVYIVNYLFFLILTILIKNCVVNIKQIW